MWVLEEMRVRLSTLFNLFGRLFNNSSGGVQHKIDFEFQLLKLDGTKDEDFKNSHLVKSKPAKLIRITLGNISNKDLVEIFDKNLLLIISKMKEPICFIEIGKSIITYQK